MLEEMTKRDNTKWKRLSHAQETGIRLRNEYRVFSEIARKYDILRIRMKISYMAFEKCITIQELFLRAIFRTLVDKIQHPQYVPDEGHLENDSFYKRVISGELTMKRLVQEKK